MQSNTETQTADRLDDKHFERLKIIFKEIGKRIPDMDLEERRDLEMEQVLNSRNVANVQRKHLTPIEKIYKKIPEELEPFYLIMSRMLIESAADLTDDDLGLITNYILDLKENKPIIHDNQLVEKAAEIYQKIDKRIKRDNRYKKTDTTYGIESELDNLGDLNNEKEWISAIDNLQNLGMKVEFDAARELPLQKSKSPIDQLRALIELKKLNIILPNDHFSLHVNIGGIEDPIAILEDTFVLNSIIKLLSKNLIPRHPELNLDSSFQMDTTGSKPLFEGMGIPRGFNIVIRESDVVEYRDLVNDKEFGFKEVAKILLVFSILVDLIKSYSRVKAGKGNKEDETLSNRWVEIKESFYSKVKSIKISETEFDLSAHLKALSEYLRYFRDDINVYKNFKLTDEQVVKDYSELVNEEKEKFLFSRKGSIVMQVMNEVNPSNALIRKDSSRFYEYTATFLSKGKSFEFKDTDSKELRDFIASFEVRLNEEWSKVVDELTLKSEEHSISMVRNRLLNIRVKEFTDKNKERLESIVALAKQDPSFVRFQEDNPNLDNLASLKVFYNRSETLNYLDAQIMRLAFSDLSKESDDLYRLVLQSKSK